MTVRVTRAATRRRPLGQVLADWPVWLHQVGLGRLLGRGYAVICTTGRRTGIPRRAGVVVLGEDPTADTVFALAGSATTHWYRNLTAGPAGEVWIGGDRFLAAHRTLSNTETLHLVNAYRARRPFQARMQAIFFGWRWATSQAALSEWVRSVVGVALWPRAPSSGAPL